MLFYDCHVHLNELAADPHEFVKRLDDGGVYGANVFSTYPPMYKTAKEPAEYEDRVKSILDFAKPYPDRIFPFLIVHPHEEDILSKVEDAVGRGIMGFKMMCCDYYVYEDKSMRLLEKIAETGKPVLFHTGILFDGMVSSMYNRPTNWECCLEVPKLRFALGHCSWPWIDECLAVYGKFRSARIVHKERVTCEMFLDLTQGTPNIYRKELMTKLHFIGYKLENNIMFGTDNTVLNYNGAAAAAGKKRDDGIYDELGIDEATRELIYCKNQLRFLGIEK